MPELESPPDETPKEVHWYINDDIHLPDHSAFHVCISCGTEYFNHERCPKCSRSFEKHPTPLVGSGDP